MKHKTFSERKDQKIACLPISSLLPGDILLHNSYPQSLIQKWISTATGSPYTHASIYLGEHLGVGQIAEAVPPKVRMCPISRALKPGVCIGVLRTQMGFGKQRVEALNQFVSELISNKVRYDFRGVVKIRTLRERFDIQYMQVIKENYEKAISKGAFLKSNYFCSALIVACYSIVGIIGPSAQIVYPPHVFSPGDLHKDPTFGWFLGHIHLSGDKAPANDPLVNLTSWDQNMDSRWWL